ncbi:MAG: hypothetical protein V3T05_05225 [Myxococcota bacterium]
MSRDRIKELGTLAREHGWSIDGEILPMGATDGAPFGAGAP